MTVEEMNELVDLLNACNEKYRKGEDSGMSDIEFDKKLAKLAEAEKKYPEHINPDSPTRRIGLEPLSGNVREKHAVPMLSINNIYNADDLMTWLDDTREAALGSDRNEKLRWAPEYKIDGCAVSLIYYDGVLLTALTRGDGEYGDDITANIKTVAGIPHNLFDAEDLGYKLTGSIIIRGEVYMPKSAFHTYNARQPESKRYANPRNATAGAIRLSDPRECAKRPLAFIAHTTPGRSYAPQITLTQVEFNEFLMRAGFRTACLQDYAGDPMNITIQSHEVPDMLNSLEDDGSDDLDFETDGIVFKLNNLIARERLGHTSSAEKWQIALKTEKYEAVTQVIDITWQVGKTGALTPVAILHPVDIAGTVVSRATLHNLDEINRLGIRVGSTCVVEKAGKIIPHIVRVVEHRGRGDVVLPTVCPACGKILPTIRGMHMSKYLKCYNTECPAQLVQKIVFYGGRNGLDIKGLGESVVQLLVDEEHVRSISDLYHMTVDTLKLLPRMGQKSAENLVEAIQGSKCPRLDKFLCALSVPDVGVGTSQRLAAHFRSAHEIALTSVEHLSTIPDIGDRTAMSIVAFFSQEKTKQLLEELRKVGVEPWNEEPKTSEGVLTGKTVVVTGTFDKIPRKQIEQLVKCNGGKLSGSVSKNTSFVVAGDKAGSKLSKAQDLGIEVIDETEFANRINYLLP